MNEDRSQLGWIERTASLVFQAALPLALFLSVLRLTLTPAYVKMAYRAPEFPSDPYGFSLEQREGYALVSLDYLLNDAGIEFLGDREFEDGSPLFNQRELRHMRDVKSLTQFALKLWYGLLLLGAAAGAVRWRVSGVKALGRDVRSGAKATFALMGALALGLVLSFQTVFVGFHRIFFEGNTWLFLYSDTLIRLFPVRFWQQVFVFLALTTAILAGALLLIGRRWMVSSSGRDTHMQS